MLLLGQQPASLHHLVWLCQVWSAQLVSTAEVGRTYPVLAKTFHQVSRLRPSRETGRWEGVAIPQSSPLVLELRLGRRSQGQWSMLGYVPLYTEKSRALFIPQGRERTASFIGGHWVSLYGSPPTPPSVYKGWYGCIES